MMERTVEEALAVLVSAWNRRDPRALGEVFSPHADYIPASGDWRKGRRAIQELLNGAARTSATETVGEPLVRSHGEVRTAIFRWASPEEGGAARRGVISCVLVTYGDCWLIDQHV